MQVKKILWSLLVTHMTILAVFATPPNARDILDEAGPIAYIKIFEGRDAIYVKDSSGENPIFICASERVIILTPSVSQDGKYISFVVDNGKNQKVVHILGPIEKNGKVWVAPDQELMNIRGGAWPAIKGPGAVYISMPEPTALVMDKTSNIYLINGEGIEQVTDSDTSASHIWPLIHPDGNSIIYRHIPQADEMGMIYEPIASVIQDLNTGETTKHFEGQFIYMEQWTQSGEILYSLRDKDDNGNRVYLLYQPETGKSRVVHRSQSRQGALSVQSKYLATIKLFPAGGAQYDIFVKDMASGKEINMTSTVDHSESLIGWITP